MVFKRYKKNYYIKKRKQKIITRNVYISKDKKRKIIMRSGWEVKYARYLENNNIYFEYEIIGFKTSVGYYFPDFFIHKKNKIVEIVEIKGRLFPKAKLKMEQFKLLYPDIKFSVLFREDLKKMGIL